MRNKSWHKRLRLRMLELWDAGDLFFVVVPEALELWSVIVLMANTAVPSHALPPLPPLGLCASREGPILA